MQHVGALTDKDLLDALAHVTDDACGVALPIHDSFSMAPAASSMTATTNSSSTMLSKDTIMSEITCSDMLDMSLDPSGSLDELLESEDDFVATALNTKATTKPKRRRRKHELDQLRHVAAELHAQLLRLQQRKVAAAAASSSQSGAFWKHTAHQVSMERQRALCANSRLKEALRQHKRLLKMMERTLGKAQDVGLDECQAPPACASTLQPPPPMEQNSGIPSGMALYHVPNDVIFDTLFANIQAAFEQRAAIFQSVPRSRQELRRVKMEMRSEQNLDVMCLQVVDSRGIPYNFIETVETVWAFLEKRLAPAPTDSGMYWSFDGRGNDLFGMCCISFQVAGEACSLNGNCAIRRYHQDGVFYLLWEAVGACVGAPFGSRPMRLREQGWAALEPSPGDPTNEAIFRTCVFFTPTPIQQSFRMSASALDIAFTTELVMAVHEHTLGYLFNAIMEALQLQAASQAKQSP